MNHSSEQVLPAGPGTFWRGATRADAGLGTGGRPALHLHRAPIPEEEPLPGEEPSPDDDPVPHPDPVVREPEEPSPLRLQHVAPNHCRN